MAGPALHGPDAAPECIAASSSKPPRDIDALDGVDRVQLCSQDGVGQLGVTATAFVSDLGLVAGAKVDGLQ